MGEEVRAAVVAVDDDVVAGAAGLEVDERDGSGHRADHRGALGCADVLTLVDVAGAARAEASVGAAEEVRARNREASRGGGRWVRFGLRLRLRILRARSGPLLH